MVVRFIVLSFSKSCSMKTFHFHRASAATEQHPLPIKLLPCIKEREGGSSGGNFKALFIDTRERVELRRNKKLMEILFHVVTLECFASLWESSMRSIKWRKNEAHETDSRQVFKEEISGFSLIFSKTPNQTVYCETSFANAMLVVCHGWMKRKGKFHNLKTFQMCPNYPLQLVNFNSTFPSTSLLWLSKLFTCVCAAERTMKVRRKSFICKNCKFFLLSFFADL